MIDINTILTQAINEERLWDRLNQEWFWGRINNFIAEVLTVEQLTLPALVADAVQNYDLRPKVEAVLANYNITDLITEAMGGISHGKFGDIVDDRLKEMRFRVEWAPAIHYNLTGANKGTQDAQTHRCRVLPAVPACGCACHQHHRSLPHGYPPRPVDRALRRRRHRRGARPVRLEALS